jgi:hypothetical protein
MPRIGRRQLRNGNGMIPLHFGMHQGAPLGPTCKEKSMRAIRIVLKWLLTAALGVTLWLMAYDCLWTVVSAINVLNRMDEAKMPPWYALVCNALWLHAGWSAVFPCILIILSCVMAGYLNFRGIKIHCATVLVVITIVLLMGCFYCLRIVCIPMS